MRHAFLRAIVSTSGRFHGEVLRLLFTLADKQTPTTSWPLLRPSLLNLRFTAGVGVGISGACGPPLVWRARKPLLSALRSSAALALGLARQRAPVPEHRLPVLGLCLRPQWMQTSLLFSSSLLFLLVCVALKLRSLRLNTPPCVASRYSEYKPTSLSLARWRPTLLSLATLCQPREFE